MTIITNQKELENLLKGIPQFPATITSVLYSLNPPLVSWLFFKYDNSEIKGQMELPNKYIDQLADECGVEHDAVELEKEKINVYTPSIESGIIYAIKSSEYSRLQEQKLDFDKKLAEFREKFKDQLK